ncbi:MAG: hypothetical protein ACYDG2_00930, partial [Ruminiclostridium sp.]
MAQNQEYLDKVKAGTAYAIAIYNHRYSEIKELVDPDDYERMNVYLNEAVNTQTLQEIDALINRYQEFRGYLDGLNDR